MTNTNVVPQGLFGPGICIVTRTDVALSTPYNIGYVNEFSTDLTYSTKPLYGQNQLPLLVARGTAKPTGKMKAATLSGGALNAILLGQSWTLGTQYDFFITPSTAIPPTPFHITPTIPSSGTFYSDLGVINAATGEPMILVTGTPLAGQYAQAAGVYTFSSADNVSGISVIITVAYSFTTGATGQSMVIQNQPIGTTPTFKINYKTTQFGATYFAEFPNCICNKWSMGHKLEDWAMPEFDFEFFCNSAGVLGTISLATQG